MTRLLSPVSLFIAVIVASVAETHAADVAKTNPATVAEAAAVLDLMQFPLPKGSPEPIHQQLAGLSYEAKSTVKQAFEYVKQYFTDHKWKEEPNGYASDDAANGSFSREGYVVTASASGGGEPGTVRVTLMNLGNVDTQKLPLPPGCTSLFTSPANSMFTSESSVADALAACRKLLAAEGWEPYGTAGDTVALKQNAIQLNLNVVKAAGLGDKTMITLNTQLMSIDLPAPPEANTVQYADSTQGLFIETPASQDDVVAFYKDRLAKLGWKPTTEDVLNVGFRKVMIFRNARKDMLTLEMHDFEGKTRAELSSQTAAELAALEADLEAKAAKKAADAARPLPKYTLNLPSGAGQIETGEKRIEFTVGAGRGRAAYDEIAKRLKADGWKAEADVLNDMVGEVDFEKDGKTISVGFIDTAILPAEFDISGRNIALEVGKD